MMKSSVSAMAAIFLIATSCIVSADALGMTFAPGQPQDGRNANASFRYGTIDAITPGAFLKIDGVEYIFSSGSATVRDENGRAMVASNLTKGMKVKFVTTMDGSRARIDDIWMAK
jgi:hypothetical protein